MPYEFFEQWDELPSRGTSQYAFRDTVVNGNWIKKQDCLRFRDGWRDIRCGELYQRTLICAIINVVHRDWITLEIRKC